MKGKSRNELLLEAGGWLVIFGLVIEVVLALCLHPDEPWFEKWPLVIANLIIVAGVWLEIRFGGNVQAEAKARTAEAEQKAAEANKLAEEERHARVKLEAQIAPRALTKEQFDELQNLRGKVAAVNLTSSSDVESTRFCAQIAKSLFMAGIDVTTFPQRVGLNWTDLYIVMPSPVDDFRNEPLFQAFRKAGFPVGCGDRTQMPLRDLPSNIPVIMVGERRGIPHGFTPYVWTLDTK